MLDTVNLVLKSDFNLGHEGFIRMVDVVNSVHYCELIGQDINKFSCSIKLSYPKYFYNSNAYLISNPEQCLEVHRDFCIKLKSIANNIEIKLIRVDTPFTYIMKGNFNSYNNIYWIMASVYSNLNPNYATKGIYEIIEDNAETLIFADNRNTNSFNKKITIYDQHKKIEDFYKGNNPNKFNEILFDFPDLNSRMRIEASKRIRRNEFTLEEFYILDIFREYVPVHAKYVLENILNISEIENLYEKLSNELACILTNERLESNFTYENFIYKNLNYIVDYEIIKRAVYKSIHNDNTRENAITVIRKILRFIEQEQGLIIFNAKKEIINIRIFIENIIKNWGR